ncbi:MAG: cytochrome c peroxidase, partial [Planctomycetaceae bacterium]|nr:cytochrome c peroxidase [Planctomycetaceae bacterium]
MHFAASVFLCGGMMSRFSRVTLGVVVCALPAILASGLCNVPAARLTADEARVPAAKPHARPIGLAYLHADQRLLVANRDSGTITTINPETRQVVSTWQIPGAEQLADFIVSENGPYLLTCSTTQNRVWLLKRLNDQEFSVLETLAVPAGPVGLSWLPDGKSLNAEVTIACQWARAVLFVKFAPDAASGSRLVVRQTVSLPHAPRRMLAVQEGARLLVADAFGGSISVIKSDNGVLERTKKLPGHNLHGLGMMQDKQRVIVAHQILNPVAETSHDGVFWGIVMTNNLRLIPLENFLSDTREPLEDADIHFLGEPKHGAADPTSVTVGRFETMLTTLGGVDELAVGVHLDHSFDRIKVGRRPVAVVTDTTGKLAY